MLSVFTREWLELDVAVFGGRIAGLGEYAGGERVDAAGSASCRGSSTRTCTSSRPSSTPAEFARAVVPHGTTAVVTDPHEIANVLGRAGVEWMLEASESLPLDVFVMAPSCVPASALRVARRAARAGRHGGDPAPSAGARRRRDDELPGRHRRRSGRARADRSRRDHVDGHAPGVTGRALNAYVAAGIRSDHEATTFDEALEKRRARDVGADPRGVERPQPARPAAAGDASTGRSTARSAPTTASPTCCSARATSTRCAGSPSRRGSRPRTRC